VRKHERAEQRPGRKIRARAAPLSPGEQLGIGRIDAVPELFHLLRRNVEGLGKGKSRQSGTSADSQIACREF
jgi:hypothetical protein